MLRRFGAIGRLRQFELLSQSPDLDFLTMDYLAEVSMSILAVSENATKREALHRILSMLSRTRRLLGCRRTLPPDRECRWTESRRLCTSMYRGPGECRMSQY